MSWLNNTPANSDDTIRTQTITDRVDELREQRLPLIVAGWNMPGYLPDSDPAQFDNWDSAFEYIVNEMDLSADMLRDSDDQADRDLVLELETEAKRIRTELDGSEEPYGRTIGKFHYWVTQNGTQGLDADELKELITLESLLAEIQGYGSGHRWEGNRYPHVLINEDHLTAYAEQYAEDIGAVKSDASWPNNHIDWEAAAKELFREGWGQVDYDGTTFYYQDN